MCRWICAKAATPTLLADVLTKPEHSVLNQAFDCRLRLDEVRPLNGDGFGVAWYDAREPTPCVFVSVAPAWNNTNLARLCAKTRSTLVLCHVRAASGGFPISEANCHPWNYDQLGDARTKLAFMHNGYVSGFSKIKRRLQAMVADDVYHCVHGNTDSEWCFALFLTLLGGGSKAGSGGSSPTAKAQQQEQEPTFDLPGTLLRTIDMLNTLMREAGTLDTPSLLNFAVTDGQTIACTRYTNTRTREAASLYWSSGARFAPSSGDSGDDNACSAGYRMHTGGKAQDMVIIASEPLTFNRADWCKVPDNSMLVVSPNSNVRLYPIRDEFWAPAVPREPEVPWWTVAGRIRAGTE